MIDLELAEEVLLYESILNTRYTPEKNANWFSIFIEVVILAIAS